MLKENDLVRLKGTLAKTQSFNTVRGLYRLNYYKYEGNVYLFKYKDGALVECVNLSK